MDRKIDLIYLFSSAFGLFISLYLWNAHVSSTEVVCTTGCEQVINGPYGELFGVPWGAFGFAFYALIVLFTILRKNIEHILLDRLFGLLILGGVGATLYLRYLEFFKIGEICIWCWGSALAVAIIFIAYIIEVRGRWSELLNR